MAFNPTPETTGACIAADLDEENRRNPGVEEYRLIAGSLSVLREIGMTDAEIEREFGIVLKPQHRAPVLPA